MCDISAVFAEHTTMERKPARKGRRAQGPRVVALTGAFGFLGRRLLHRLEADSDVERIVALDARSPLELARREGESEDPARYLERHHKVSAHQIDLAEAGTDGVLATIFENEGVDTVCHLAFLSNPTHQTDSAHELETIGTMYVLNAVRAAKVSRLVSRSSTMCYGALPDNPAWLVENHPLRGGKASRYVADKADADRQVQSFAEKNPKTRCTILRLGAMLGGSRTRNFWTRYFTRPVVPTVLGYDPLFQFLYSDDAVEGIYQSLKKGPEGAFNLVGRGVLPLSVVVERLGRRRMPIPAIAAASSLEALWSAQLVEMPPSFVDYFRWSWVADGSALERAIGFRPGRDIESVLDTVREEFA